MLYCSVTLFEFKTSMFFIFFKKTLLKQPVICYNKITIQNFINMITSLTIAHVTSLNTFYYWIITFFSHCNFNVAHRCQYIQKQCYANKIHINIPFNFWKLVWLWICVKCMELSNKCYLILSALFITWEFSDKCTIYH